jgi:hypothetical protein
LISMQGGCVRGRPALARYGLGEPRLQASKQLGLSV